MTDAARPIDPEADWIANSFSRDQRQLTLRAALGGAVIGVVMCLSNL